MLLANILVFEYNPSDNLLIYIKNNIQPSIEPWGAHALKPDQSETCLLIETFCFLFLRKSHKKFNQLPDIPFYFRLKMRPSCKIR